MMNLLSRWRSRMEPEPAASVPSSSVVPPLTQSATSEPAADPPPAARSVSTNYRAIDAAEAATTARALRDAWQDVGIPERQRELVDDVLRRYRAGEAIAVFDSIVDLIEHNISDLRGARLLEIGCSSGFYSEVFALRGFGVEYAGCDYSSAFIDMARRYYPQWPFSVQDATALAYADASFDIVVSGACLLHIPEYEQAIAEAARVAGRWVIFHRTPVLHATGPSMYTKEAYGVPTFEIHFNEQALARLFVRSGLRIVDINTHSIGWNGEAADALAMKSYLCEKVAQR